MMAFHIACPITCERICYCELGFGGERRRRDFEDEAVRVLRFLQDPWTVRASPEAVATVIVPRIEPPQAPEEEEDGEEWRSAQAKRAALQKRAAAVSVATEDYVRKLEAGVALAENGNGEVSTDPAKEDQTSSTAKVMCRICFSGENEGSEKAKRMLSCKLCGKKYHKSCVKSWADNRDLFHWSFWTCPSCRICEVCRRTGDPNKFMFCKRCDAAYHCYCLQPPHKNVGHGPYLCPKHTRCHSCESKVHGSGHSTRWFLGYNFCDACGRLFTKEKYCPVCLKVYRDSESTPMVCCDVCQRWVHCSCDGISEEKYLQFQSDRNLYYKCAACRGDCYQIRDMDDAVQELWRRRDKADHNLIISLRSAAGLPTNDDFYSLSPSEEEDGPTVLNHGKTLRFSVKGLSDKVSKSPIEQVNKVSKLANKKPAKKKIDAKNEELLPNLEKSREVGSLGSDLFSEKTKLASGTTVPVTATPTTKLKVSLDKRQPNNLNIEAQRKSSEIEVGKSHDSRPKEGKLGTKAESIKGTKLVIHLGGRNRSLASSPMSDASSCHREQEKSLSNGNDLSSQHKTCVIDEPLSNKHALGIRFKGEGAVMDNNHQLANADPKNIKENDSLQHEGERSIIPAECPPPATKKAIIFRRRRTMETLNETVSLMNSKTTGDTNPKEVAVGSHGEKLDALEPVSTGNSISKDSRPLLKLKFKNSHIENHGASSLDGERSIVKGQRSKRKRPSTMPEKVDAQGNEKLGLLKDDRVNESMDANWILQRLGKDAVGKRVEIQIAGDTWQKGVVSNLVGGTTLSVDLDTGRSRTLELGKHGVRLIPQKQKRTKL